MLEVRNIAAGYGPVRVLRGLSLTVRPGEITCLLGRNGAGKTTAMKAIMGLLPLSGGQVLLDGEDIGRLPAHEVPRRGIGYIPQGRRLFADLTVAQNLEIGMRCRKSPPEVRDRVLAMFPRLADRMGQRAGTLSGGEQQMLATARALCLAPRVLLLDEPTEGLQPSMIALIRDTVLRLRDEGVAILLVEQRLDAVLATADRAVILETGAVRAEADAARLRTDPDLLRRHLGV
ncbi:ABC transporter ATP-binding protein [Rhodovulum sp. BSW8]|uniref:Amino acid/amide ABC transporter ATP-binding protein 2 (HAAT family) n=1 Tax=Rhodovulum visakhapatnamense TaxID=364297 RepID=A0A4R8G615_9RHOB|nr:MULTISPECIES: ABC transporter ATP-binding protein [Rhodovulum]RBO53153.1 ABC transporter ATP-binding protein [Rhodovulum sp. BSW8]TDX33883.1 amino acid/amide ABC transporter ATP-binding protein 2 (HAAT family) [Rhodovulum visakhapatnamense]